MNHTICRQTGNILVTFALLILALAGLDQFAPLFGWPPTFACWLRPLLVLGQTLAVWAISLGVMLVLFPWSRSGGVSLIAAGILVATLPGLLAAHLGLFCGHL